VLERLFSPLRLGPVELPNRIVSTAHQTTLVHDHVPTDDFVAYHEARARGGAGMIVLEASAVHPSGLLTPHTLGGYLPEIVDGYARVAEVVRPHGTRLLVQLFHGGREQIASPPRRPALAPSAVPTARFKVEPRAVRAGEVEELVAGYARAAELAVEGGLHGVEISAAHRYLIEQFLTPELNRRDDEWRDGKRFLLEVVRAVRAAAPGIAVGVRLSADSDVARRAASLLADEPVDFLSVALGESSTYLGSSLIVPPPPTAENAIAERSKQFRLGKPLVAASRVVDPAEADRLIEEEHADAIGMTRALIADPDLPRKAREGATRDIVFCIACNACIAHYHAGTPIACAANPRTGRELTLPRPERAGARRRVVVVGAGPAGLAAALEAGEAGHEVIVLERSRRIGGQLALGAAAPVVGETATRLRDNYDRLLSSSGVDVRLGTPAGPADVAGLEPDAVVVATGARPYEPSLPLEGVTAVQAWDVLGGAVPHGRSVVVADWSGDAAGLACAEVLHAAGNEVTVAIAAAAAGEALHQYRRNLALGRLYRAGVRLEHHLELVGARAGAVRFRNVFAHELETEMRVDLLVLALGRVPDDGLAPRVRELGLTVDEAGDCLSPRSLEEAVLEGTLVARRLLLAGP
jgi:2,4-dienoyl-CoA reductase-like NADH-dependent reductase (Old Yellow Enzyme family)/thioredoxin reductase